MKANSRAQKPAELWQCRTNMGRLP